jgi:hypothetical protein
MIHIGRVYGGPELRGSTIDRAISKLVKLRGTGVEGEAGSLDVVFHVPGAVQAPDFTGIRTGRFSKKERMLAVQISVPQPIVEAEEPEIEKFLLGALRTSIDLAAVPFRKAGVSYPQDEYLALIDRLERGLVH